jgi:hypothetical protein
VFYRAGCDGGAPVDRHLLLSTKNTSHTNTTSMPQMTFSAAARRRSNPAHSCHCDRYCERDPLLQRYQQPLTLGGCATEAEGGGAPAYCLCALYRISTAAPRHDKQQHPLLWCHTIDCTAVLTDGASRTTTCLTGKSNWQAHWIADRQCAPSTPPAGWRRPPRAKPPDSDVPATRSRKYSNHQACEEQWLP